MDIIIHLSCLLFLMISAIWLAVHLLYTPVHDPQEPPLVTSRVPFIGHILGLLRYGTRYYQMTRYCAFFTTQEELNQADTEYMLLVPDAGYQSTH